MLTGEWGVKRKLEATIDHSADASARVGEWEKKVKLLRVDWPPGFRVLKGEWIPANLYFIIQKVAIFPPPLPPQAPISAL